MGNKKVTIITHKSKKQTKKKTRVGEGLDVGQRKWWIISLLHETALNPQFYGWRLARVSVKNKAFFAKPWPCRTVS